MKKESIILAGSRPWNRAPMEALKRRLSSPTVVVTSEEELLGAINCVAEPGWIFFLHWSSIVPPSVTERFECVCFHMTDVPYGRGGSPLQNLIQRGHRETQLTALRMEAGLDAGPVYLKRPLSLEGSTAEEIYLRASRLSCEMVETILNEHPSPVEQSGEVVRFRRRKPTDSALPEGAQLAEIHDHIRMLDAEGYPRAFLDYGNLRLEFSRTALYDGEIRADVRIVQRKPEDDGYERNKH